MTRKLRIFLDEQHPFEDHPALLKFDMPPRKLREKGDLLELPEGFEPLNPEAYFKRYGHRLAKLQQEQQGSGETPAAAGSKQL